jgi:hypothetical protein
VTVRPSPGWIFRMRASLFTRSRPHPTVGHPIR